jgi:XTP/dITP diphosphohydrolase
MRVKELVLATRNRHKGEELAALLADLDIRIRTLRDFPGAPEVDEDGTTCEENAIKKAKVIAQATGLPAVADDTGLEVDALGGRPGVFAARYAGEHATYEDNCLKLLLEMAGVPREKRTAKFVTVAALAMPDGTVQVAKGLLPGLITEASVGSLGFGYDPVFLVPHLDKTLAELPAEVKNRISHRARALSQMRQMLVKPAATS